MYKPKARKHERSRSNYDTQAASNDSLWIIADSILATCPAITDQGFISLVRKRDLLGVAGYTCPLIEAEELRGMRQVQALFQKMKACPVTT